MDMPNPREDLERKTVECLDDMAYRLSKHQITMSEFSARAHLLWKVTAGLVDASISLLCESAAQMADETPMRKCLVNGNGVFEFVWTPNADGYVINVYKHGETKPFKTKSWEAPREKRAEMLESAFTALRTQGYFLT